LSDTPSTTDTPGSSVTAFVASMGLSAAGVTMSMLGATAITAATNGGTHGALWTGAFLIVLFVVKAAAVRFVPSWSDRLGPERMFLVTNVVSVALWAGAGLAVVLGTPGTVVILLIAPIAGIVNAVFAVETPLLAKAFLSGHSMAAANARVSVARGVACAVGALAAGAVINAFGPGWALIARAALSVPLAIVILRMSTAAASRAPEPVAAGDPLERPEGPSILEDPAVRRIILLAIALTAATAPVVAMIVPIAQSLRQTPLIIGASIMTAAMAAGELLSPFFVHRLERRAEHGRDPITGALLATAGSLVAFGVVSTLLSHRPELAAWVVVGLAFGGLESASHSTVLGALVAASGSYDTRRALAIMKFATNLAAPVGFVVWALLLDGTNGQTAILVAAAMLIVVTLAVGRPKERHAPAA